MSRPELSTYLPFAHDAGGHPLLLQTQGTEAGVVFFWNLEPDGELERVTENFDEFLSALFLLDQP